MTASGGRRLAGPLQPKRVRAAPGFIGVSLDTKPETSLSISAATHISHPNCWTEARTSFVEPSNRVRFSLYALKCQPTRASEPQASYFIPDANGNGPGSGSLPEHLF